MQSWIHVLEWRATVHPDVPALADDRGRRYTYAELRAEFERRAGGWAAQGIGPGDVVAIVAKNSADFLVHTFALLRAGAVPALVNWRLSARELSSAGLPRRHDRRPITGWRGRVDRERVAA
jgi:acyl-CoA synthetase (AMP-forming)/AMP-acid ligase II